MKKRIMDKEDRLDVLTYFNFGLLIFIILLILDTHRLVDSRNTEPQIVEVEKEVATVVEVPIFLSADDEVDIEVEESTTNYLIEVTQEDIDLMARVVMSEASICDIDTKYAVASTIVNRVLSEDFPNTVFEVVHMDYAYSTQDNGEPNADCYKAVEWALKYRVFPTEMFYFRTGRYHDFGKPLVHIDGMYFSTK